MQFLFYTFDGGVDGEPGSTRLQVNAAFPYGAASRVYAHKQTDGGADARLIWLSVELGSTLYLQDKNDSLIAHRFTTTGLAIDRGYYLELPVRWESGTGSALNANQDIAVGLQSPAPVSPTPLPPPAGPPLGFAHVPILVPLVSITTAKAHLRVVDTAHDADINQKLQAAQMQILAKLAYAADPLWTDSTIPRDVQHAILLLLTHFYEHRGDDIGPGSNRDEAVVWREINNLLALNRDPVIA